MDLIAVFSIYYILLYYIIYIYIRVHPFVVDFPVFVSYFTLVGRRSLTCEVNGSRALIGASILRSKWTKRWLLPGYIGD